MHAGEKHQVQFREVTLDPELHRKCRLSPSDRVFVASTRTEAPDLAKTSAAARPTSRLPASAIGYYKNFEMQNFPRAEKLKTDFDSALPLHLMKDWDHYYLQILAHL